MAKTGICRLLIASAIDAAVYHRFVESPEETFDEFDIADEDRELLRHPDHRLLRVLGAALAEEKTTASAASAVADTPLRIPTAGVPLPDVSLVLTVTPCAIYDGEELRNFAYAASVSPLPEGAEPETLPPPADTVLPGKPLPPLRAVVRVSAIQMQDAAGNPLVGLSASLLQSTNMSAPPPTGTAGNPAKIGRDLTVPEIQSAIVDVRSASAGARYDKLIELLRVLRPEGTS